MNKINNNEENSFGQEFDHIVPENLFVDQNPPQQQDKNTPDFSPKSKSIIEEFINRDYYNQGFEDGYQYHSKEIMDQTIRKIISEYIFLLDRLIDEKESEITQLEIHRSNVEGLSDRTTEQLQTKKAAFENNIVTLRTQKELASQKEGWIMVAVNVFELAYKQGMEKYHDLKTFTGSTGLF